MAHTSRLLTLVLVASLVALRIGSAQTSPAQDSASAQYARVQHGQWRDAIKWLQQRGQLLPADASLEQRRRQKELELDWQFTVGLFDQVPTRARTPEMTSHPWTRLAWAIAGWNSAHAAEVRDNAEALAALRAANPRSVELQLIEPQARALVLLDKGLSDSAVAVLREAARLEAAQPIIVGPPAVLRPAHEALAELMLALGRNADAQAAFERALVRLPGRARPLAGLSLAARAAGDTASAERALTQLRANFRTADEGTLERLLTSFRKVKPG
jgi:tetratricopeptide (TPR) repeat protein